MKDKWRWEQDFPTQEAYEGFERLRRRLFRAALISTIAGIPLLILGYLIGGILFGIGTVSMFFTAPYLGEGI